MATKSKKKNSDHYVLQRLKALPWGLIIVVTSIVLIINVVVSTVSNYNQMVLLRNTADSQWQQVEVQYQRRLDLIPNLVAAVEGAQIQEQEVFGQLAEARSQYGSASSVDDKATAASQLDSAISRLLLIVENYPQLASSQLMQNLQAELAGTENKVSVERLRFNDDVRTYNTFIQVFPKNMVANVFGFDEKTYFASSIQAQDAPKVDFKTQ